MVGAGVRDEALPCTDFWRHSAHHKGGFAYSVASLTCEALIHSGERGACPVFVG